jgi:hypothetical protein
VGAIKARASYIQGTPHYLFCDLVTPTELSLAS